ncbi:MAG: addiction module protein [Deltaproteobacteria bacterium]|nr:addiction module protein [Deltaproteobacteria bacterium]
MTSAAKKILEDALALPDEDRRLVAETLLDSFPRETTEAIEQAWNEESARRAGALERGEAEALDGADALGKLETKIRSTREG